MTYSTNNGPLTPYQLQQMRIYTRMKLQAVTAQVLSGVSPRGKPISVLAAADANVWKGADYQGVGALQPGDDLYIRLVRNELGDLRANLIIANHVNMYGFVTKYADGRFRISAVERRTLRTTSAEATASLDAATMLSAPAGDNSFKPGTLLQIIGVREPNGNVRATHVMVLR